mmetsp:Transcript_28600/g.87513  ORF Transcript_28600/g.87513 Transcript_28600/m.87513 type:complete len:208 (-) Transcript_28600:2062-2685(-)
MDGRAAVGAWTQYPLVKPLPSLTTREPCQRRWQVGEGHPPMQLTIRRLATGVQWQAWRLLLPTRPRLSARRLAMEKGTKRRMRHPINPPKSAPKRTRSNLVSKAGQVVAKPAPTSQHGQLLDGCSRCVLTEKIRSTPAVSWRALWHAHSWRMLLIPMGRTTSHSRTNSHRSASWWTRYLWMRQSPTRSSRDTSLGPAMRWHEACCPR